MPSPFPGMNPWLENPSLFPNLHQRLITYAGDDLQEKLGTRYFISIGERVYVEEIDRSSMYPDVHIVERSSGERRRSPTGVEADEPSVLVLEKSERREVFLEIQDATMEGDVVTVLEVLSPSNKRPGEGRDLYLAKQARVLRSSSNLVEIDLLRGGEPTVAVPATGVGGAAYRVVVSPADDRRRREVYPSDLRHRLPRIAVPLRPEEDPVVLDLQALLAQAWKKGAYELKVDYRRPAVPALSPEDERWARQLLAAAGEAPPSGE